jgi:hypothetical protein
MTLEYIRNTYGVPAKRGARVLVDWYPPEPARYGTITGSDGARHGRLRIRIDGETRSRKAHPIWRITYLPPNVKLSGN